VNISGEIFLFVSRETILLSNTTNSDSGRVFYLPRYNIIFVAQKIGYLLGCCYHHWLINSAAVLLNVVLKCCFFLLSPLVGRLHCVAKLLGMQIAKDSKKAKVTSSSIMRTCLLVITASTRTFLLIDVLNNDMFH